METVVGIAAEGRTSRGRVLVAVPAFNEEVGIGSVVLKARRYADEVLVIDDGSSDATSEVAALAGARVVRHEKNSGKARAVRTAFRHALEGSFDALVLIDGDGQHEATEIPLLLEPILSRNGKSVDIALGFRHGEFTEMPMWRRFGKRVLDYATAGAASDKVTDSQCGFRAFNRRAMAVMNRDLTGDGFSVESETLVRAKEAGLLTENVTIHCRYDGIDGSTKGPVAHAAGVLASVVTLATNKRPLLTLGIPSFLMLLGAFALAAWTLQSYNRTDFFSMPMALGAATLAILGTLGLFFALTLNTILLLEKRIQNRLSP